MSLQDKVPVEPIAPDRMDRLERRVVAAAGPLLARPRRASVWPVGLALAGACAGAVAMYALRPAPPAVAPASAPVAVSTDGARGATLDIGEAQIAAGPDSRYDLVRAGGGIDLRLDHGAVHLDVAPRKNRPPLWVHAGDVGVRVVGTAFTVTRTPGDGDVMVEVEHGTVEVHRAGAVAPVTGGQRWSSRDGTVLAVADKLAPSGAGATAGAATSSAIGANDGSDTRIGAGDTHTGALATGPAIDVRSLGDRDRPTIAPGAGPGTGSGSSSRVTPRTGAHPGAGSGSSADVIPPDADGDVRSEIRRQPLDAGMAVAGATALERAAELRRLSNMSRGAEAATALYSLARIQHMELGKHGDALKTIDLYRTRFKAGAELESVLWLRLRILCASKFDDRCREAAYSYVRAFGDDEAASDKIKKRVTIAARVPLQLQ